MVILRSCSTTFRLAVVALALTWHAAALSLRVGEAPNLSTFYTTFYGGSMPVSLVPNSATFDSTSAAITVNSITLQLQTLSGGVPNPAQEGISFSTAGL